MGIFDFLSRSRTSDSHDGSFPLSPAVSVDVFSSDPVSSDFLSQLKTDLEEARAIRFCVAYVSNEGLKSIGKTALYKALKNELSFGISSLACTTGYEPFLGLQKRLGDNVKLKYFMDPVLEKRTGHDDLRLLHSKVVYLWLPSKNQSITYIGSHNWSKNALGDPVRHSELSVRFEEPFDDLHLEGAGNSIAAKACKYLKQCFDLPLCLPATVAFESRFKEWFSNVCEGSKNEQLDEVVVLLTIRDEDTSLDSLEVEKSIYFQCYDDSDGGEMPALDTPLLILIWQSKDDLIASAMPTILVGRVSTVNALESSSVGGTNQADTPIAGFDFVIRDKYQQDQVRRRNRSYRQRPVSVRDRPVEYFDFLEVSSPDNESSIIDDGVSATFQFHIEIDEIVYPATEGGDKSKRLRASPRTFAVSDSRRVVRKRSPGYKVEQRLNDAINSCLINDFNIDIDTSNAKALPYVDSEDATVGLRVAAHPLHDTFLPMKSEQNTREFYGDNRPGELVASLTSSWPRNRRVKRILRVFVNPLDHLLAIWSDLAKKINSP